MYVNKYVCAVTFLLKCGFVSGQHFSLRHIGIYEPPRQHGLTFCPDLGVSHRGFSVGAVQDLDDDGQAATPPEHGRRVWCHGDLGKSSERSSCLSSRSNSVLTLTDTEHENKSDSENGRKSSHLFPFPNFKAVFLILLGSCEHTGLSGLHSLAGKY